MPDDPRSVPEPNLPEQQDPGTGLRFQIPPQPAAFANSGALMQTVGLSVQAGPLPPHDSLAGYGQIDPSFPNRIMVMAEKNAATERLTSERAQLFAFIEGLAGRLLGYLFATTAILVSAYLALHDRQWVAGVIGGSTVVAIALAFITGKVIGSRTE